MTLNINMVAVFLMICFVTVLSSCNSDDSDSEPNDALVGTWRWTINERLDCGQDEGAFDVYDCSDYCFEITLMADGRLTSTIGDENGMTYYEGNYIYFDNILKMCVLEDGGENCTEGEVTISGDKFQMFIPKESLDVCDVIRHFEKSNQ